LPQIWWLFWLRRFTVVFWSFAGNIFAEGTVSWTKTTCCFQSSVGVVLLPASSFAGYFAHDNCTNETNK
jgi:hypothetical protein